MSQKAEERLAPSSLHFTQRQAGIADGCAVPAVFAALRLRYPNFAAAPLRPLFHEVFSGLEVDCDFQVFPLRGVVH